MRLNSPTSPAELLDSLAVIPGVRWYHVSDPSSPVLDQLAERFGIHPLQVEDCRHRRQTARLEEHERYSFIVIKVLLSATGGGRPGAAAEAASPQESAHTRNAVAAPTGPESKLPSAIPHARFEDFDIILGPDCIVTVDEGDSGLVGPVAARIAQESSLHNPDCVAHALIDAAVDHYLPALDRLGETINRIEDRVIRRPTPPTLREVFRLKRELLEFRRVATAMRETVNGMVRRYDNLASAPRADQGELRIYYRDVYDHVVRVIDLIEINRDLVTGALDIYLSAVANRTNEIMKVLTLWGTLALPFLIVTSFYGMNVSLPLQEHPYVLLVQGLLMCAAGLAIYLYFRRRHWF